MKRIKKIVFSLSITSGVLFAGSVSANYELSAVQSTTDRYNIEHVTYQQYDRGVPVFGGQMKVHRNIISGQQVVTGKTVQDNLNQDNVQSNTVDDSVVDVVPTISVEEAIKIAQDISAQSDTLSNTIALKRNLYIFNEQLLNKLKPSQNVLVWQIELYQEDPIFHEYYYIDAHTGELVYQISGLYDAITRMIYDCSYMDGDCYIDSLDPVTGYIYGRSEGQSVRGDNPLWYVVDYLTDTDDLYDNLGNIYDYYLTTFARDGANDNGGMGDGIYFPVTDTTGLTYIDYYFNSESDYLSCPNAFFDGIAAMHYCKGWVTNDISGHEYAHAVNYFSILDENGDPAGLTYTNEIGALNEANSDVFGEALQYYVTGSADWLIGEDSPLGTLRSMSNPPDYTYANEAGDDIPFPDRYNSENLYCGEGDNGGVHLNSSVVNKAAYLIAMGGTFNTCTVTGLGREKEEAIFYRAQTTYYTTTTDFNDAYVALLAACNDLYDAADCKEVEKALRATEMNQAGFCSGIPAVDPGCTTVEVAPTITNVTSNTADGYYKVGASIDIAVTFSEVVSGDVTVTLETGETDRQCAFTLAGETAGTCNYTVQAGDVSGDLNVQSITGTIIDSNNDAVTTTLPTTNLADNKAIVIDTIRPKIPTKLKVYTSPKKNKRIKIINPRTYSKIVRANAMAPYVTWQAPADVSKYYVKFTDQKKISRKKLLKTKNKRTKTNLRGTVTQTDATYYLHMLLQDYAGNRSKPKIILRYQAKSS